MQTVTSQNTSINTSKLPAIWKKIDFNLVPNDSIIIDYGAGQKKTQTQVQRYLSYALRYSEVDAIYYYSYDPYWNAELENQAALTFLKNGDCYLCICANVLNVIDDDETIRKIISEVTQAKHWVFQIYEGNQKGIGKYTKNNTCYQRNQKVQYYLSFFKEFPYIKIKGNLIMSDNYLLVK